MIEYTNEKSLLKKIVQTVIIQQKLLVDTLELNEKRRYWEDMGMKEKIADLLPQANRLTHRAFYVTIKFEVNVTTYLNYTKVNFRMN